MEKIPVRNLTTPPEKINFSLNFSIRTVQDLLLGENLIQELHRHDFCHILVLQKGAGFHEIDFKGYEIKDNTVFFLRPGQAHRLELNAKSTGYMIQFTTGFYSSDDKTSQTSLTKISQQNYYELKEATFQKVLFVLTYIFQEYHDQHENYIEIIKANLRIFFLELMREQNNNPTDNTNLYAQERLDEFRTLLETHIRTHKPIAAYAEMLHLTPYQLNNITKTLVNKKASELITEAIILESKRYLLATSNQVNQIADYMGYEDVSYFIRFFRKHTGFSPETFRKNFK